MFNPLHLVVHYVKKCHGRVDEVVHVDSTLNIFIPLSSSCKFSILTLMKSHSLPHSGFRKKWRRISSVTSKTSKKPFATLYPPIPFHSNSHEFKQARNKSYFLVIALSWKLNPFSKVFKGCLETGHKNSTQCNGQFSLLCWDRTTGKKEQHLIHLIHFSAWTNSFTVLVSRNRKNGRKEKWMLLFVYHSSKWCHTDDQHRVAIKIQEKTDVRARKTRKKEKIGVWLLQKILFAYSAQNRVLDILSVCSKALRTRSSNKKEC